MDLRDGTTKSATQVLDAAKDVIKESKRQPTQFWCDEGKGGLGQRNERMAKKEQIRNVPYIWSRQISNR